MDALLDILKAMRLSGGIFLDGRFTAPWCVSSKLGPEDCAAPGMSLPRHIIAYHYVISGRCLVKVEGEPPVMVEGGEIVVLPRNDEHVLGSTLSIRAVNGEDLFQPPEKEGALARINHGGNGEETKILCGYLANDLPHSAFIGLLPSILKINVADGASGDWIESSIRFAGTSLSEDGAHSPMLARLAELLFMEAVRRYFTAQPPIANAWAAGMRDPIVSRALGLLHGQIARRWTTEDLAKELALSRSAFADRFARVIGEPPMRYLAKQRLAHASSQLKDSNDPIARIAYDVGYESEAAFNRAFRREFGTPPASWRRENARA